MDQRHELSVKSPHPLRQFNSVSVLAERMEKHYITEF